MQCLGKSYESAEKKFKLWYEDDLISGIEDDYVSNTAGNDYQSRKQHLKILILESAENWLLRMN